MNDFAVNSFVSWDVGLHFIKTEGADFQHPFYFGCLKAFAFTIPQLTVLAKTRH